MQVMNWLAPLTRWESLVIIAGNLLPLLGIHYLGWDASTLIILYWMETAIVGFWLVVRVAMAPADALSRTMYGNNPQLGMSGPALALFLTLHATLFMSVHVVFLNFLAPGEWARHFTSPVNFVTGFVIPSGVWIPLLGLFVMRAVITIQEVRTDQPISHLFAGFYGRIVLMQLVILTGGFASKAADNPAILLTLIVVLKIVFEVYWERFGPAIEASFSQKRRS